jgi:hypothetical protein
MMMVMGIQITGLFFPGMGKSNAANDFLCNPSDDETL